MNISILIGNIGKDPELRPAQGEKKAMCTFRLATSERFNGENKTTWHSVVAFGKQAEIVAQYFHKGSRIALSGRIQNRKYQDADGNDKYVTEIMMRDFEFVDRKSDMPPSVNSGSQPAPVDDNFDDNIPF